jgi:Rrf2 family protein
MRLGEGVEWAIHCCTVLALVPPDAALPGGRLAEFHGVPAPYLAKSLQALTRAGITESTPGRKGGFRLARPAADISLLDVVQAIDGDEPAFTCTEIRRRGPARVAARQYVPVCSVAAAMYRADAAWRRELAAVSIADLVGDLAAIVPADAAVKAGAWFREVLG